MLHPAADVCTKYRGKMEERIFNFLWERIPGNLLGEAWSKVDFCKINKTLLGRNLGEAHEHCGHGIQQS